MLYLVDTFSLVFQVYHAIRQPMTGTRGQPTNAVFGLTGDIQHLLKDKQPSHLIFAMESTEDQQRVEIYKEYKAHRGEMPEDLRPQIPLILDVIEGFNIPIVSYPGWEADDVIATLARRAEADGFDVRIVSNDKDLRQLITPKIKIYNIRKKQVQDEEFLLKEWGIRPDQVIDFQSLVGDSVDNVPGVPLVGPKKASALLEKFGTLDDVLANAQLAPGKKLAENLATFADQARLSRNLVTLRCDLDLDFDWDAARVSPPNHKRLLELFEDFGFGRYADEQRSLASAAGIKRPEEYDRQWQTIRDEKAFATFVAALQEQKRFCVDLETTSINPMEADIVGWAFCWEADVGCYIPVAGPPGDVVLDPGLVLAALKPILEDPDREIVNQNVKYDMVVLKRVGVEIANLGLDPMVGDYLLDAGARTHGLDELSKRYLSRKMIPISDLIGKGKKQLKMFEVDVEKAAEYASEDADVAWQLAGIITEKLQAENLWDLYWDLERPLIPVLADMEYLGIRVDADELGPTKRGTDRSSRSADARDLRSGRARVQPQLARSNSRPCCLRSWACRSRSGRRPGRAPTRRCSTRLASEHTLPAKLIEHRQLTKLKGTYLDALPKMINPQTGRIHTSFSQVTASTGRLSSSDPNLQNIPIRTEEGRRVRRAFVPKENRLEAHLPGLFADRTADAGPLLPGSGTAGSVPYGSRHPSRPSPPRSTTSHPTTSLREMRTVAKAVNFGVIYGQTAYGLAHGSGDPQGGGSRVHRRLLRPLCRGRRLHRASSGRVPSDRIRDDDSRPSPRDYRHPRGPVRQHESAGTHGGQHRDSGLGGGFDQTGDDQRASAVANRGIGRATAAADSRRTGVRSTCRRRRRGRRPGERRDGNGSGTRRADRRRRLTGRQLAGHRVVRWVTPRQGRASRLEMESSRPE